MHGDLTYIEVANHRLHIHVTCSIKPRICQPLCEQRCSHFPLPSCRRQQQHTREVGTNADGRVTYAADSTAHPAPDTRVWLHMYEGENGLEYSFDQTTGAAHYMCALCLLPGMLACCLCDGPVREGHKWPRLFVMRRVETCAQLVQLRCAHG